MTLIEQRWGLNHLTAWQDSLGLYMGCYDRLPYLLQPAKLALFNKFLSEFNVLHHGSLYESVKIENPLLDNCDHVQRITITYGAKTMSGRIQLDWLDVDYYARRISREYSSGMHLTRKIKNGTMHVFARFTSPME